MKILSVGIRNFGAIGEADMNLDDKGLVLIQGINSDDTSQESNGSGKSTLPDALSWCLYDRTAKDEFGDKIINRVAKKDCSVEVIVVDEDTDDVYRISRHRKHKVYKNMLRLELQQGPVWRDLTKGTDKLTQDLVNKVIGCNYEVFTSAIYAGQEAMPDLPGMTDKQLKVLVEESAGIAQLQEASEVARKIVAGRKVIVQDITNLLTAKQSVLKTLDESLDIANKDRIEFEDLRAADIKILEAEKSAQVAAFDDKLEAKINKKLDQLTEEEVEIKAKIAGSDDERRTERDLSTNSNAVKFAKDHLDRLLNESLAKVKKLKHSLDHIGDKEGSECTACGHIIEAGDLAANTVAVKKSLDEALKTAKQDKQALEVAREASEIARSELATHIAAMTDVTAMTAALSAVGDKKLKLGLAKEQCIDAVNQIKGTETKIETAKTKTNPYAKTVSDCEARIVSTANDVNSLNNSRMEAADSLFVAEQAARVFSPAGVRAHILDTVTPHLNNRTSHYLSTLTDGNVTAVWSTVSTTAKGELREKFVIDVASNTGGESFKSLSGGEKRKVRLACAMALQDLVASRASKPIKLFIADEIDHALDPAGLERLMTILEDKSRDKGTVLVISHSDLRDNIRNSITVTKKGGKATLEASCLA